MTTYPQLAARLIYAVTPKSKEAEVERAIHHIITAHEQAAIRREQAAYERGLLEMLNNHEALRTAWDTEKPDGTLWDFARKFFAQLQSNKSKEKL